MKNTIEKFHECILGASFDCVRDLLQQGHDVNATWDSGQLKGWTLLHLTAAHGHDEKPEFKNIAELAIGTYKADLNVQNEDGDTPLHKAIREKNKAIARVLVDFDAKLDIKDKNGNTPIKCAAKFSYIEVVAVLDDAAKKIASMPLQTKK